MNNLLQILAGLLIAMLVAIFAGPYFVDWNTYKSEIEAQASRVVGRPLSINGDVNLRLLPAPYLRLEDIRIDAPGAEAGKPALFEAKAFRLWLAAPPLLRGAVEVEQIELIDPVMRVLMDEEGNSNWANGANAVTGGALPFTPTNISLESMKISNGALQLTATGTRQRSLMLEAVDGDLSASSLSGPFKFDGDIGREGARHELRFNSGRIDDKGELRFKALLRSPDDGERYNFDGSLLDLGGTPSVKGVASALFPFLELPAEGDRPAQIEPLEIKTSLEADARKAALDQILVTFVHRNRPQMMTGSARMNWNGGSIDLDGKLQSRLLDLDQLKDGLRVGNSVADIIGALIDRIRGAAARIDSGRFALDMQQIKLNSDLIQDIDFRLARTSEGLSIEKLAANLPGENRLDVSGRFAEAATGETAGFSGPAVLRGRNLGRLVTWASGVQIDEGSGPIRERPFSLRGDIELSSARWALSNARGDIADTAFSGAFGLSHSVEGRPGELALQLTAGEIDTAAVFGRSLPMRELFDLVRSEPGNPGDTGNGQGKRSGLQRLIADKVLKLQLQAGRVGFADLDGQDLVAVIDYDLNRLDIRRLSVRSQGGLRLSAEGLIDNIEQAPKGALTTDIDIASAEELGRFLSWFGDDKTNRLPASQLGALAPLRLAVMLQTEPGEKAAAVVRVNGTAGDSHVGFTNRIVGSNLFSRRESLQIDQLEVTGTMANDKGSRLLAQLVPHLPAGDEQLGELGPGKLWLSAAGLPERGLSSRLEFSSDKLTAGYDGRIGWQQNVSRVAGKLRVDTTNPALGFALAGLDLPAGEGGTAPLKLTAQLDKTGETYAFTDIDGSIGGSELQGRASFTRDDKGAKKIEAVLLASELEIATLFRPLLEGAVMLPSASGQKVDLASAERLTQRVEANVEGEGLQVGAVVTSRRFDPQLLDGVGADLLITADRLGLGDGVALKNGEFSAKLDGRRITVDNLGGDLWGGRMMAKGTLDLSPSIAELKGSLDISNARLEEAPFKNDGAPLANGKLSLAANFGGKGVSPAGILAFLNGKGEVKIAEGRLNRFNPAVIDDAVEDELAIWDQSEEETPFSERFKRHLRNADMELAAIDQSFVIADGILDFGATQLNPGKSKIDLNLNLAVAPMNLHARFTIRPAEGSANANVPAAAVLYEGALAGDKPIEPKPEVISLEQNVKVLKLERNVQLLEKQHREDEEIARAAAERREQERLAAEQAARDAAAHAAEEGIVPEELPDASGEAPPASATPQKPWNPFADSLNGMR